MRICLMCDEPFEPRRKNQMLCSSRRCRNQYYQLRKKLPKPQPCVHDPTIAALEKRFPEIGKELRTIKAIYGHSAVGYAITAVNIVGKTLTQRHRTSQSSAPLPPAPLPPAA